MVKRGAVGERFDADYQKLVNSTLFRFKYPLMSIESLFFVRDGDHNKFPEEEYSDENNGIRYLRVQDIKEGKIINERPIYVSKQYYNTIKRSHVKSGYVLFSIMASVGSVAIYPDGADDCTANRAVGILVPKSEKIISHYFQAFCDTEIGQKLFETLKKGGVQQRLNLSDVNKLKIPVPAIDIQSQIVAIYTQAYEIKRQKEAEAKALLDSIEAYLLKSLGIILPEKVETKSIFYTRFKDLQGKRFDPFYHKVEFDILETSIKSGLYPIQKMGTFLSQINYGASVKSDYVEFGIPFLRISDLERNEINLSEMKYLPKSMKKDIGNAIVYEDNFLISRSGTIGVVARVSKEFNGFAYGSFMIKFCLKNDAPLAKDYLSFFLNCELMQKIIFRNKIGAIQGNITIPTIKNFDIPLPPLSIQNEIAEHIQEIRAKAKALEKEAKEILEQAKIEIEKMILGE